NVGLSSARTGLSDLGIAADCDAARAQSHRDEAGSEYVARRADRPQSSPAATVFAGERRIATLLQIFRRRHACLYSLLSSCIISRLRYGEKQRVVFKVRTPNFESFDSCA